MNRSALVMYFILPPIRLIQINNSWTLYHTYHRGFRICAQLLPNTPAYTHTVFSLQAKRGSVTTGHEQEHEILTPLDGFHFSSLCCRQRPQPQGHNYCRCLCLLISFPSPVLSVFKHVSLMSILRSVLLTMPTRFISFTTTDTLFLKNKTNTYPHISKAAQSFVVPTKSQLRHLHWSYKRLLNNMEKEYWYQIFLLQDWEIKR